ncbi:hypothetical protein [Shewanella electrodiphila]|nr:hypothetical protein [Shewanella electrodiphila]
MFSGDAAGKANELKETYNPEQLDGSVYPRPLIYWYSIDTYL